MLPYTRGGTGSVVSDFKKQLDAIEISVTADAGAQCDNIADDASKIQNAVNMAIALSTGGRGAVVKFPRGVCAASVGPTVPRLKTVLFRGEGMGASVLRITGPSADGITFANDEFLTGSGGIENMSIEAGAGFRASKSFAAGSTGTGVKAVHMNNGWGLRNVDISGFQRGFALLGSWNTTSSNIHVRFFSGEGIYVDTASDNAISGGNKIIGATVSNAGYATPNASTALRVRSSGGDFFAKIDMTGAGTGVLVDPYPGTQVSYLWFDSVLADTCVGDAWVIDGTNASINGIRGTDTWGSYSGGNGLVLKGNNLRGFRMKGMATRENKQRGIWIQGGSGIELTVPEVHSNSRGSNGVYPGIEIADGVNLPKSFAIMGGSSGNWESAYTDQGASLSFKGVAANFRIEGVDFSGPGGGHSPVEFADDTKLTAFKMLGNLPAASYGVNPSERYPTTLFGDVASGTSGYLTAVGFRQFPSQTPTGAVKPALVGKAIASVFTAPGAGQSFTYRLVVNGTPVGSTGVISGASAFQITFYPGVTLAPWDRYEVAVTGTSGTSASVHNVTLQIEP